MGGQSPGRVSDEQLAADLAALEAYGETIADGLDQRVSRALRELQEARAALRQIVELEIDEALPAGWHFAEVRDIARRALGGGS